jgi:hypothetical protein
VIYYPYGTRHSDAESETSTLAEVMKWVKTLPTNGHTPQVEITHEYVEYYINSAKILLRSETLTHHAITLSVITDVTYTQKDIPLYSQNLMEEEADVAVENDATNKCLNFNFCSFRLQLGLRGNFTNRLRSGHPYSR